MSRPLAIKKYWGLVAALGCVICGAPAQIHHVHGGSMIGRGVDRGGAQKTSDWLVIPICHVHHVGDAGIDNNVGVRTWEERYGLQALFVDEVGRRLGVDNWGLAAAHARPSKILPRRL